MSDAAMRLTAEEQGVLDAIKEIVTGRFDLEIRPNELNADTRIIGEGIGLDSIAILDLVAGFEQQFDITVEDEDLVPEAFETLGSVARWGAALVAKRAGQTQ